MLEIVPVLLEDALAEDSLLLEHLPDAIARAEIGPQRPCVALSVDGTPRYVLQANAAGINVGVAPTPGDAGHEMLLSLPEIELVGKSDAPGPEDRNTPDAGDPKLQAAITLSQILKEIREKAKTAAPRPVPEGEPWRPKPKGAPVDARPRVMEADEVEHVLARHRQELHPIDGPHLVALLRSALAYGDEDAARKAASMIAPGATFRVVDDHGWLSIEAMEGWKVTTFQLGGGSVPQAHALLVGAISLRHQRLNPQSAPA